MYKSPIKIIYDGFKTEINDEIYKAVLEVGIKVDKEELMRALRYDRAQYEAGYMAGYEDGEANARMYTMEGCAVWL